MCASIQSGQIGEPAKHGCSNRRFVFIAVLVSLLFLVKFIAFAWLVTPIWGAPDEIGHYSYVHDVARGEWPKLGHARMAPDAWHSFRGADSTPVYNYIAQHPPLFYVLDAPAVMLAKANGMNFEDQVRAARMLPALFGALTVLGLILFLARATNRVELGFAGAIFLAATPMFTQLSSGVSHDTMVACLATWAAYWCLRWLETDKLRNALFCAALVAAGIVTKVTVLAFAVPLFFPMAWRLWQTDARSGTPWNRRLRPIWLWLVMFTPACLWITRNLVIFQQAFPDASMLHHSAQVSIGFFEYMLHYPVWQHTIRNFTSVLLWKAPNGPITASRADGIMAYFFLAGLALSALYSAVQPLTCRLLRDKSSMLVIAVLAGIVSIGILLPLRMYAGCTFIALLATSLLAFLRYAAKGARGDPLAWLLATSAFCVMCFGTLFYWHLWANFSGSMVGTHARYFYPVFPLLLLLLVKAFRDPPAARVLLLGAVTAMVVSSWYFVHMAFPFYGQI